MSIGRREFLQRTPALLALLAIPPGHSLAAAPGGLIRKPIPSSGEQITAVGLGTARRYESAADESALAPLRATLQKFGELGGVLIDTAPSYGQAESVVGGLLESLGTRGNLFLSTKIGANGREAGQAQLENSFRALRTKIIDVVSLHNLRDTDTQLALLRDYKQQGRIRYLGITTSFDRQYTDFEAVIKRETLDFIQVDYALDNREAARRIIPAAHDLGMGVMVNLPFGRGRLFSAVQGKPLPEWATEFDCRSWAQFFLKYLISHEAVTCAAPGMAKAEYVLDNLAAATGRLPDASLRRRMETFIDAL
ncbi:MAG: aldo/keto reductase [Candidatus Dactylopiibacterium carminicum]|uniref:Aldo/keto reductase n=1 Tax=Candidatus Dactylopiibacterium carminicum TaxID=857335 RepID=A0A272EP88_9RHOO|nr:aldo/keto reductase [Candidatus Dactylopiibacterium carminicum]KAF7598244.1 aldo/keto reductase [Candidatus Dactylopiibacterium carminicum]PAS91898.1 MAG: aldo/keto reductase [Candidatus Dactylopiibacterium carminicum]PAS94874.1 MAG: aldo/keto reductase [Candidatus Dactylopiibacterium carminicum]PAS97087.1 MAG: aldo/keto reductase [Candidatus Dactylopiibacterium carminicum]